MLFFFFFSSSFLQIFVRRSKRKYAKVIYGRYQSLVAFFFFLCVLRAIVCMCACVGEQMGEEVERGSIAIESSRSFHPLLCHRSFMASAFDKAPDEASRKTDKSANKSGL